MCCLISLVRDGCVTRTLALNTAAYMHLNMQQLNSNLNGVCTGVMCAGASQGDVHMWSEGRRN